MCIFRVRLLLGALASTGFAGSPLVAQDSTKVVVVDTTTKYKSDSLPLKPERTFRFDTDEGTWISLDVSPDGNTIVFELLGDLYTVPAAGGQARRITSGLPFDTQPRYSPDGNRIVFLSDRDGAENVWTSDKDGGKLKQVTRGKNALYASPVWTPDGDYVVVSRQDHLFGANYQLWMFHRNGGSGISLTKADSGQNSVGRQGGSRRGIDALGPAFGSDPRYIWYGRHRGGFGYNLTFPQWQLATFDRETGKIVVQSDIYGSSMRPVLSPDGKWMVYATRYDGETGLRLRDLSSGSERWLRYPVQRDDQESRFTRDLMPGSAFTPDSRALIASYAGKIWRVEVPGGRATAIPFKVQVEQEAGPLVKFSYPVDTGDVIVRQVRNPVSSPDGKRIAFSALDRLYVMDWPKGTPRRLTRETVHEQVPAWSPDGKWIAYVSWGDSGGTVMKVKSDGGKPERLTGARGFFDLPAWSPDGRRIVVVREPLDLRLRERDPTGYDLAWLPANGGQLTRIAFISPGGRPHFSQDTSRIYVTDPNDGLVSMRWDGTDRRRHLKVTGYKPPVEEAEPETAEEIRVSPDGKQAVAEMGNRVYLVNLPKIGAQIPEVNVATPKEEVSFPAKRLTRVGGDFISWSADGRYIEWSIGRSYFRYDPVVGDSLDRLKTSSDSARADSLQKMEATGKADTAAKSRADSIAKLPGYEGERVDVTIKAPRDVPRGTVVLRGARIITMKGDEVIERGDVVVKDNRITYVGPSRSGQDAGATVIDVAGKTIIPGLVDVHSHMWPTWGIHETQVWKYLINLAYGVTTTRDPQTSTTDILTYADQVETGELMGPRIYSTGPGVFWDENFQSLDEAREALRRYSEYYHTNTIKQYLVGNRKQRQWVVMAAKELKLMPTIEGGLDFKMNLTAMLDGYPGHEHSLPITPLARDVVGLAARSGITYTPTLLVAYGGPWAENYFYQRYDIHENPKVKRFMPHEEIDSRAERGPWVRDNQHVFPRLAADAAKIIRAGGRVGLGGHSQMDGLGTHWELWALASGGMKSLEALRIGTIYGAEAIGFGKDLGSLEPGKLADLIVLHKNPLDNIKNTESIAMVMKNGRLYQGDDLTERWPRQKKLPEFWWSKYEPVVDTLDRQAVRR